MKKQILQATGLFKTFSKNSHPQVRQAASCTKLIADVKKAFETRAVSVEFVTKLNAEAGKRIHALEADVAALKTAVSRLQQGR